jgi:hypothetical protein
MVVPSSFHRTNHSIADGRLFGLGASAQWRRSSTSVANGNVGRMESVFQERKENDCEAKAAEWKLTETTRPFSHHHHHPAGDSRDSRV